MRVNGIECFRSTIHSEDDTKYYTKNGFILKRKTNKLMTLCKHYKGFAYGYEIGWRRKDLNGVNAVIRLYFGKPIEKVN